MNERRVLRDFGADDVYEAVVGDAVLVARPFIDQTAEARAYEFHTGWYPAWIGGTLLFRSDGASRRWIEIRADGERIGRTVRVPACGLVVLRRAP